MDLHLEDLPEIAPVGDLDDLVAQPGRDGVSLTVVGYGAHDSHVAGVVLGPDGEPILDVQLAVDDHRAAGEVRPVDPESALTVGHNLQRSGNPGRWSGGTCCGDSGGPVLHGDTLVGLTSFGIGSPMCRGNTSFAYPVDIAASHAFMAELELVSD